ncbi:hypothetical protein [Polyangium jinanense]|uniref:Uncharacterized protein n=1 Tax=Polyangium jinanense TaxID=2829994 RepID=A0A9X3XEU0_9BACT|nr:hypothetical protein [Polyangium jinanense]MDC3958194.1 hypothetical protein [Polyangium jinanense]MDC3988120.1 hypothetical protein [Polyangium jinanense]
MRSTPRRWLLVLAAAHLLLVTLGAAGVELREVGPIGRLLDHYGLASGAGCEYDFFTSRDHGQFVLHVDVIDAEGRRTTHSLGTGASHEAELRVAHIAGEFETAEPALRRELAKSLAAKMFERHPEAREVVVRVEYFVVVLMDEHRSGREPRVSRFYDARFRKPRPRLEARHGSAHSG